MNKSKEYVESMKCRALTLWEPWASLVAGNHKKFETRSWKTDYRGELYIHAAASLPQVGEEFCPQVAEILGIKHEGSTWYDLQNGIGNFGMIIARCNLIDCLKIEKTDGLNAWLEDGTVINEQEYLFGDYTPGRYAWMLKDIVPLAEPIPMKGKQRIWTFDNKTQEIMKKTTKVKFIKLAELQVSNEKLPEDEKHIRLSMYECDSCHWQFYGDIVRFGHGYDSDYKQMPDFCPGCGRKIDDEVTTKT